MYDYVIGHDGSIVGKQYSRFRTCYTLDTTQQVEKLHKRQCTYKRTIKASPNRSCCTKAINITYTDYVFVALVIKHSKRKSHVNFYVMLTVHLSIFISVINQLDAQHFCFAICLFHASTCFEHMCSSPGGQNCITQPLVSSHLNK